MNDPDALKNTVETKVKHVFKTSLRAIEMRFGTEFEGYDQIRKEILRVGNNAIRELKEVINAEFGIETEEEPTKVRINKERANG